MPTQRNGLTLFYLFEFEQNVRNKACFISRISTGRQNEGGFFTLFFPINKLAVMKKVIKQVLGIDVAQKELVVCLARMFGDLQSELYAHKTFANTAKGFGLLLLWVKKLTEATVDVSYVMEATGVYHESFAYFLSDHGLAVSIVLPNKISNYAKSLTVKTVTDKTASEAIARFGLERQLDKWEKPSPIFKCMKQLTRERGQVIEERSMIKNQLHAENAEAQPNKSSLGRIRQRIGLLDKQEKEIAKEIAALIKTDETVSETVGLLCSLTGVGILTAAIVLGETNGFDLIRNKRQLTSYAGLDVKEKQSGTSVKEKPKISKKGNRFLRKGLHLPALTAIRHDERFKTMFVRLVGKHGIKMKAVVAVQRKLLEMMYTIYKTNTKYDKEYLQKKEAEAIENQKKEAA
jgi:transposase